ncbi:Succinate--CoA ligase [GDP-forming] subunit beta, partial [Colletotrichum shisoi]
MASRSILSSMWRGNNQQARKRQCPNDSRIAHEILKEFGIPVSRGKVARRLAEARAVTEYFDRSRITKPQTLKSGRCSTTDNEGSEGSIGQTNTANTAKGITESLLGHQLKAGGRSRPDDTDNKFFATESIEHEAECVWRCLGASEEEVKNLHNLLVRLYEFFTTRGATLVEINSLEKSSDGTLTCGDARLMFDDAAGKRQMDVFSKRGTEHEVPDEVQAEKYGPVYVRMDGDIGSVVNGAGLAMATHDAIALHGGASADSLDAGGQATTETMVKAFEIILRDERVKAILVNVYGGITRGGDMIAESILGAAKQLGPLRVPMVVRLQGTDSELGLRVV